MDYRYAFNGKKASLLGYGAMRLPTVDGKHAADWWGEGYSTCDIDQPEVDRQVKRLLDGGVTYFDTAPFYDRAESERRLGEALAKSGYKRDEYILVSKLSSQQPGYQTLEKAKEMLAGSLKALRTDYLDAYLLHSIGADGFENFERRFLKSGVLDWVQEERKRGTIRNLGFSYHGDARAFEWCLKAHDDGRCRWDLALIQLNFVDWKHAEEIAKGRNLNAEYLYNELNRRGIKVIVMEPLLGGRLARYDYAIARHTVPLDPTATPASWAFRFCASHPGVCTVLSGMTRMEHVEENLKTFSPIKPLTEREFAALERAAEEFVRCQYIPCNSCNYCMPCPYGLDIPALLVFRNEYLSKNSDKSPREILAAYEKAVPEQLRRADHCTGCARCLHHCPQQIDIAAELDAIARQIDELRSAR